MHTDFENEFLFTGTVFGYIKIWLVKNYCLTVTMKIHVCMPLYRLQFPFLINDRIRTRAKAALKNQPSPLLLSSYKGHTGAVLHFEYIQESKLLLTASADKTVRAWTLSGRYIGNKHHIIYFSLTYVICCQLSYLLLFAVRMSGTEQALVKFESGSRSREKKRVYRLQGTTRFNQEWVVHFSQSIQRSSPH